MGDVEHTVHVNTFPLTVVTFTGASERALRIGLLRSVEISISAQASGGPHITIALGIFRVQLAFTFTLWDKQ